METVLAIVVVLGGLGGTGVLGWYLGIRKDRREADSASMSREKAAADVADRTDSASMSREKAAADVADRTITLLEDQNRLLRQQLEEEQETRKQSIRREERLEDRVDELERDYRKLVETVTLMGFCAKATECEHYDPGDRGTLTRAAI